MRFAVTLLMVLFTVLPVRADALFFDELSDVPVMPALQELPDRTLVFDKPSGRIAQVTAVRTGAEGQADIEAFYAASLPQLGWQAAGPGTYVREGQKLTISPVREGARDLVVFRLEPR